MNCTTEFANKLDICYIEGSCLEYSSGLPHPPFIWSVCISYCSILDGTQSYGSINSAGYNHDLCIPSNALPRPSIWQIKTCHNIIIIYIILCPHYPYTSMCRDLWYFNVHIQMMQQINFNAQWKLNWGSSIHNFDNRPQSTPPFVQNWSLSISGLTEDCIGMWQKQALQEIFDLTWA